MAVMQLRRELARGQVAFELIPHTRTETAGAEAIVLGLSRDVVAKTVVVVADGEFVRLVVPASHRLDLHKAQDVLGSAHVRLASESELAGAYPMFELGAVPPVGGPTDRVVVDRALTAVGRIVFDAGTHEESIRLAATDLLALAGGEVADLCRDDL